MIFIDLETHLIAPGNLAPRPVCAQVGLPEGGETILPLWEPWAEGVILELLYREDKIIGHNIAFDMLVLARHVPGAQQLIWNAYEEGRISDTLIRQKLIDIAKGLKRKSYSLEAVAALYDCAKDGNDPWRLRYSELEGIPIEDWPDDARMYAQHDVDAVRDVYLAQGPTLPDEARQCRAAWWLQIVGAAGIWTDPARIRALEAREREEYRQDQQTLIRAGLVRPTGTRDTKAAKALMQAAGVDRLTETGEVSLDLEACQASGDPVLMAYARYGSRQTLLKRIADLWNGINTPINLRFDSLVSTGRTSCIRGKTVPEGGATNGFQAQNVPRAHGMRECFRPASGEVILAIDYAGMELCTWAQVCIWVVGYSRLAEALTAGVDPHLALGAEMLWLSYDEALARRKEHEVKDARQAAKAGNFGFPGGLGVSGFIAYSASQWGIILTPERAAGIKARWLMKWEEAQAYFQWIRTAHKWVGRGDEKQRTIIRHLRSDRTRGGCTYTEACNSPFQGLAADAAKAAGFALVKECELGSLGGWRVWNFVHDEFLLRGPENDIDRALPIAQGLVEREAQLWLPDVKVRTEATVAGVWSKNAELIRDQQGRIIPWRAL